MHPSILINWEKQCKPKSSHVLKRPLFWSFRAMQGCIIYIYMCVHVCVFSQPCTWTVEGSDHIYQVHSQFCSGISSVSLSTPSLVFENTHLQPASNHAPRFSNVLPPSDLQLFVWWVAKEVWLPSNLTLPVFLWMCELDDSERNTFIPIVKYMHWLRGVNEGQKTCILIV